MCDFGTYRMGNWLAACNQSTKSAYIILSWEYAISDGYFFVLSNFRCVKWSTVKTCFYILITVQKEQSSTPWMRSSVGRLGIKGS